MPEQPGLSAPPERRHAAVIAGADLAVAGAVVAVLGLGATAAERLVLLGCALLAPAASWIVGASDPEALRRRGGLSVFAGLLAAATLVAWTATVTAEAAGTDPPIVLLGQFSLLVPVGWLLLRIARLRMDGVRDAVLVGSGAVAQRIADITGRHPELGLRLVGYVADDEVAPLTGVRRAGGIADLPRVLRQTGAHRVVVAFTPEPDSAVADVLRSCDINDVVVEVVPRMYDLVGMRPSGREIGGLPLIDISRRRPARSYAAAKRTMDLLGASLLITVTAPLMLLTAVLILLEGGRPVIFRQERIGLGGRRFTLIKFRTMLPDADRHEAGILAELSDGRRDIHGIVHHLKHQRPDHVTRIGRFLRRTSLDELPQLFNVLRGDMSLVGPRPLRAFEVDALRDWQRERHAVRPGLTGLWQVSGRSDVGWDERMALDYSYVRRWSMQSDLEIAARTVPALLRRRGAA